MGSLELQGHPAAALRDDPEAYIPGDRRRALATGLSLPVEVAGGALFVDISGFTPLSEGLAGELGSQRASEVLTGHLNRVFHALIAELHRYGGDVIYFSGDAVTCWLDGDDGLRAVAAALGMQEVMAHEGVIETPGGSVHRLALKAAVAVGEARRFVVGDPEIQLHDVLAGRLVDRLVETEQHADKGEVVADESALASLQGLVEVAEQREHAGVVARLLVDVPERPLAPEEAPLPVELVRRWLLPPVYERLGTGRGEFLAELRPAFPLFVSFGGIDYDDDPEANEKLDEFVRAAQRVLARYGGYVLQLTLGDKGAHLYAVFGTPLAHEDDAARACAAALELRALEATTAARDIRIGLTHGRLRSGTYGHARRRTFVCLGDAVNLSARLMAAAPGGAIYVAEAVRRAAGEAFDWEVVPPLRLKGKSEPVTAFALAGAGAGGARRELRYALPIVGRDAELDALGSELEGVLAGEGRIVSISAEAGLGKSRLVAEFVRTVRARGVALAYGECQSFGANTAYLPWREIVRGLLGLDETQPAAEQLAALEQALRAVDPSLVARAPLLDLVLGLPIPDSDLTRTFEPELRKASLEDLVVECLRARAYEQPLVLVLEDAHWLDSLSRDLLAAVARVVPGLQVMLLVAHRPLTPADPSGLEGLRARVLRLEELSEEAMAVVVFAKLTQVWGDEADATRALVDLVQRRAQGNPFYAEELVNFVHAQGIDPGDERALRALELPNSLHSLILSRIDGLSEGPRRTLKVASVLGRTFDAGMLPGVYPDLGADDDVLGDLATLSTEDLVSRDRLDDERSYIFKHVVTQEVAYESIPFALRATLHVSAGGVIEAGGPEAVERNLDLLAHHFWHGDDEVRKREYLLRAGDAAQAAYANAAAIDYFERLAPLVEETARIDVLLKLGKVLELVGEWERARAVDEEALSLAEAVGDKPRRGWAEAALAEIARRQGSFDEALDGLDRARVLFEASGEQAGVARVLHVAGTVAAQRGDTAAAQERYEESLAIRERLGDRSGMAAILNNLGLITDWGDDHDHALALHEQALALRREIGDRRGVADSMTNIGMNAMYRKRYAEALTSFAEAMRLNREVGDVWMVALSHHNLGNAARELEHLTAARADYAEGLRIYANYADAWALAQLIEDVAVYAARVGLAERAAELVGAADRLRDDCGSPRSDTLEQELAAFVATDGLAAIRTSGRRLDLQASAELALDALAV